MSLNAPTPGLKERAICSNPVQKQGGEGESGRQTQREGRKIKGDRLRGRGERKQETDRQRGERKQETDLERGERKREMDRQKEGEKIRDT